MWPQLRAVTGAGTAWTLADIEHHAVAFDVACLSTPEVDHFCSSSAWVVPAAQALMPSRRPVIATDSATAPRSIFAAMANQHPDGFEYIEPLELAWGLASPLLGAEPVATVELALHRLAAERHWRMALLAGIVVDGAHSQALQRRLPRGWVLRLGQPTLRHRANIADGVDGFLARRSAQFRKTLLKNVRRAERAGISFAAVTVTAANAAALFERILACEQHSWKGRDEVGMSVDAMRNFYAAMLPMLAASGAARLMFASNADRDIAYVLGARLGAEYRGLQFSYHDDYAALSLGSLCQYHQIVALVAEGVELYDLGSEMEYKQRWAEENFVTTIHTIIRR